MRRPSVCVLVVGTPALVTLCRLGKDFFDACLFGSSSLFVPVPSSMVYVAFMPSVTDLLCVLLFRAPTSKLCSLWLR